MSKKEKKWEVLDKKSRIKSQELSTEDIIEIILNNRGIKTKKDIDAFLHADISTVSAASVGIDKKQLTKAIQRIQQAITDKEQIVVFGDYDVDGITGTAILWETLHAMGANVTPYIPNRTEEGYGLSTLGIENCKLKIENLSLIITVDNGIVASDAVDFANENNIDVIITDHHTTGEKLPKAFAIVHTTAVCGAAVGYLLSQEIIHKCKIPNTQYQIQEDHLSLVALATVADLVPLIGPNRVLLKFGLAALRNTTRPGLLALFAEAKIDLTKIGTYEIGHIIGPRLNAMGRLESAMDSLRLLCTKDRLRAQVLADTLSRINKERQQLTQAASLHAIEFFRGKELKKVLFMAHDTYEEGIIGLVAGKLVEEYYLPAIVLAKGEKTSKASARSIAGFNIIEFIRTSSSLLLNAGGHPMAAGFTIETNNISALQKELEQLADTQILSDMLLRTLRIDCALPIEKVGIDLYLALQQLSPFGMGNPEPTFVSTVTIKDIKTVGADNKHLKLKVTNPKIQIANNNNLELGASSLEFDAIAFGMGDRASSLKRGEKIEIVYTISENVWNGKTTLQLKIKDIKK